MMVNLLTYMACYQVNFIFWLLEHFASLAQEIQIACSMKAILADCILLIQIIRQSVHVGMRRHTLVKSCVKDCDLQPSDLVRGFASMLSLLATKYRSSMLEQIYRW